MPQKSCENSVAQGPASPRRGCGQRTALFGLQRPPLGTLCCLRLEKPEGVSNAPHSDALFDDAAPYILTFLATNAKAQLVVSLDPFLAFPAFPMLSQQGLKVLEGTKGVPRNGGCEQQLVRSCLTLNLLRSDPHLDRCLNPLPWEPLSSP